MSAQIRTDTKQNKVREDRIGESRGISTYSRRLAFFEKGEVAREVVYGCLRKKEE